VSLEGEPSNNGATGNTGNTGSTGQTGATGSTGVTGAMPYGFVANQSIQDSGVVVGNQLTLLDVLNASSNGTTGGHSFATGQYLRITDSVNANSWFEGTVNAGGSPRSKDVVITVRRKKHF
jgi:hypothetical protein